MLLQIVKKGMDVGWRPTALRVGVALNTSLAVGHFFCLPSPSSGFSSIEFRLGTSWSRGINLTGAIFSSCSSFSLWTLQSGVG
jgi:hypothetical protein